MGTAMKEVTKFRHEPKNRLKGKGKLNNWSWSSIKVQCLQPWWRVMSGHTKAQKKEPCHLANYNRVTSIWINHCWIPVESVQQEYAANFESISDNTYHLLLCLSFLVILGDLGCPNVDIFLQRNLDQRNFEWKNFDVTLKMLFSVSSFFIMGKEDVFLEPFLIPSSPGICITWNQTSDGWLKTSSTNWKLACVTSVNRYTLWGGVRHAAAMCHIHPMMLRPSLEGPSHFLPCKPPRRRP